MSSYKSTKKPFPLVKLRKLYSNSWSVFLVVFVFVGRKQGERPQNANEFGDLHVLSEPRLPRG